MIDDELFITFNEGDGVNVDHVNIENGDLIVYYRKENEEMAKVNLGSVVGPQGVKGDTGLTGAKGDTGLTGAKGDTGSPGISPTFSIENGNLYADYDNPYIPS